MKPDSCRELLKFVHLLKTSLLAIGEQIKFTEKDFDEASRVFTNKNDLLALLKQVSITSIEEITLLQVYSLVFYIHSRTVAEIVSLNLECKK